MLINVSYFCHVDSKTTCLIKCVTQDIVGLSGLTRNPHICYLCYTCQPEFDTKN